MLLTFVKCVWSWRVFFFCQMIHFTWLPSTDIKFKLNYFCHRLSKKNGCVTAFNTTSPGAPRNLGFIRPHKAPFVYSVVLVILKERWITRFRVLHTGLEWAALCVFVMLKKLRDQILALSQAWFYTHALPCLSCNNCGKIAPCLGCHSGWITLKRASCVLLRIGIMGRRAPILPATNNRPNMNGDLLS